MNTVFIATTLDGYIAGKEGSLEWLEAIPPLKDNDMGYSSLMERVDALVMGRVTFETVLNFGGEWPYPKKVFVLSRKGVDIPKNLEDKVAFISGELPTIVETLKKEGYKNLYIDGGKTIQSFLKEDLIDEMILTRVPILLGGGSLLFGELEKQKKFEHIKTEVFSNGLTQNHYKIIR